MYKIVYRTILFTAVLCLTANLEIRAQAIFFPGPALNSDRDNNFNRMIGGDESAFYCYRIRHKGKNVSFFIEKYSKSTMTLEFSTEITLGEDENETFIEDIEYAAGSVYIFRRAYDKKNDRMTLFFQTVSSSGKVSEDLKEVIVVQSDHYEFVDFEIVSNPSKTKFLVKAAHKAGKKDQYKADLIIIDVLNTRKQSIRRVDNNLHIYEVPLSVTNLWGPSNEESTTVIGICITDDDQIFYCVNEVILSNNEKKWALNLYTLKPNDNKPKVLNLTFDDSYFVGDIEFSITKDKNVVVGGFLSDVVERRGADLIKRGIFSFKIDPGSNSIVGKSTYFFEDEMLRALGSTPSEAKYDNYKLDYVISSGEATYYVGELYHVSVETVYQQFAPPIRMFFYDYRDVIVAKLNAKGDFEWIVNTPLRNNVRIQYSHIFKQYIAYCTDKNIYILCNDHAKNMERYEKPDFKPRDLKPVLSIHGSNFVSNTVDLKTGAIKRQVIFKNADFCFAPIQERSPKFVPPADSEIFTPGSEKEIFIYTEDRGIDRFGKIKFD